jgi:type I restriction enzyme, S subunit
VTPMMRFPDFQGQLPEHQLGDIATFRKGKGVSKADIVENGQTPCVRYGELYTTYGQVIDEPVSKTNLPDAELLLSQANDVVIPASGETPLDIATAACVLRDGIALGGDLNIIRGTANGLFLAYYLSNKKKRAIARLGQGNSVVHLYGSHLAGLKLRIPSAPEQQKIADFLVNVDERIKLLQQRRDAVQRYKQGMMQRIFSQSIRFKRDDGMAFPDWEKRRLREAGKINPTSDPIPAIFQYIDLESVNSGALGRTSTIAACDAPDRAQRVVKIGDILFQTVRPYQQNNLFFTHGEDFVASTGYAQIRSEENSKFLYHTVQSPAFVREVVRRCTGTSYPAINSSDLGDIRIGYPHSDEQQKIADFLSALDGKITAVAAQVDQMQAFKKGLLQQMFV